MLVSSNSCKLNVYVNCTMYKQSRGSSYSKLYTSSWIDHHFIANLALTIIIVKYKNNIIQANLCVIRLELF